MKKVKWGILSTATIGREKVIPAMQKGKYCEIIAIASRSLERAKSVAAKLSIPKAYGSYDELLANTDLDAIYNPLPNHLHVPWSIKALEAGKHVLCEKPIALSTDEAQELIDASKKHSRLKVMEAFMYRHHPQWQHAKELVMSGSIGELKTIQSFFSYTNCDPENIRNKASMGGGGLMDIGCYNISLSRFIFDCEPRKVLGLIEHDTNFNVDRIASCILDFGSGSSTFTCSTQMTPYQRVNIYGTNGRVEIEIPFNAPSERVCRIWHERDEIREIEVEPCNQYTIQGDLFSQAVLQDTHVPTPLEDGLKNLKVIEDLVRSARSGIWVS